MFYSVMAFAAYCIAAAIFIWRLYDLHNSKDDRKTRHLKEAAFMGQLFTAMFFGIFMEQLGVTEKRIAETHGAAVCVVNDDTAEFSARVEGDRVFFEGSCTRKSLGRYLKDE